MKKYNKLWLLFCISFFVSCNPDPDPVIKPVLLPKVKTTEVEYVTQYTATLGGIVTSVGESDMIEYGVCLSKNPHPTEVGDIKRSSLVESVNYITPYEFTYYVEDLTGSTVYYVRAFAKNMNKVIYNNGVGYIQTGETVYGNEYKFTTDIETPTVIDADGNVYNTIQIGTQLWMAENLKTTKYNDGTKIPTVKIIYGNEFSNLQAPAYCWYNSDSLTFKNIFGALYNGYAVNTGKLAPTGWHVPTVDDWVALSDYLGGESISGGKLKSTNTSDLANHVSFVKEGNWLTPNTGATNSSGFSALPSGNISFGFRNGGAFGDWWSSTGVSNSHVIMSLGYNTNEFNLIFPFDDFFGISVRCVRD